MIKFMLGLSCALCLACGWQAYAATQSTFEVLGVSKDLSRLGVLESWKDSDSTDGHCEVRMYHKNTWLPEQVSEMPEHRRKDLPFGTACKAFGAAFQKANELYAIEWENISAAPTPPAVKDDGGKLLADSQVLTTRPKQQQYTFILPDKQTWEFVMMQHETTEPGYTVVFRPSDEPVPFLTAKGAYEANQSLLTPIKLMANNHYGLLTILLRDYRQTPQGLRYQYQPYFIAWPTYNTFSVEESKQTLMRISAYAMNPDEFTPGPNTFHPGYRAWTRLKQAKLPPTELIQAIQDASSAGKLYFLALLFEQDPERYAQQAQALMVKTPVTLEVIEMTGDEWRPEPLTTMLKNQAKQFALAL